MTPVERLKKSYELGEWSKKMNRHSNQDENNEGYELK